jgi:hypothetical protein
MFSRSARSTRRILGLLAAGLLVGCGGNQTGAPMTPTAGTSQAVPSSQKPLASVQNSAPSPDAVSAFAGNWTGTADTSTMLVLGAALTLQQESSDALTGTLTFHYVEVPNGDDQIFDITGKAVQNGSLDIVGKARPGVPISGCLSTIRGNLFTVGNALITIKGHFIGGGICDYNLTLARPL